jgi:hypothetical protein
MISTSVNITAVQVVCLYRILPLYGEIERLTINVIAGSNCQSTIQAVPVCADPSWNLYSQSSLLGGFFCCLPSQVGILSDGEYIGSCNDAGVAYPSSILASSVSRSISLPIAVYEAINC